VASAQVCMAPAVTAEKLNESCETVRAGRATRAMRTRMTASDGT
jgi:hypothetical protein